MKIALIIALVLSLLGNGWLLLGALNDAIYAEDLEHELIHLGEVSTIAISVLRQCRLPRDQVMETVMAYHRLQKSEILPDMALETPVKFEFSADGFLENASIIEPPGHRQ